jgi:predicted small secreted protein
MKRLSPLLPIALAAAVLAGCSDNMARGVYDGAKAHSDSAKDSPGGAGRMPGNYDEYEAERQRILKNKTN